MRVRSCVGASIIEYLLLVNICGLCLVALSSQLRDGIDNKLGPVANLSGYAYTGRRAPLTQGNNDGGGTIGSIRNDTVLQPVAIDPFPDPKPPSTPTPEGDPSEDTEQES